MLKTESAKEGLKLKSTDDSNVPDKNSLLNFWGEKSTPDKSVLERLEFDRSDPANFVGKYIFPKISIVEKSISLKLLLKRDAKLNFVFKMLEVLKSELYTIECEKSEFSNFVLENVTESK